MKNTLGLQKVNFVDFYCKEELKEYDRSLLRAIRSPLPRSIQAPSYLLLWGKKSAGLELIRDGVNAYIVPIDDIDVLSERIGRLQVFLTYRKL